jgi:asparagine N-glycosylation enzyme membrane subunit Stt3
MLERLGVFLFSVFMVAGSLALAVWIVVSGQAAYVDGIFMLLVSLVLALTFTIIISVITGSLQAAERKIPAAARPQAAAERAPELVASH